MKTSIQFLRALLLNEIEERKMCKECGAVMEMGMCTECGWMEEALVGGQKKLDVAEPKGKLTGADFAKLRGMKKEDDEGTDHEVSMAKGSLEEKVDMQELEMELKRLKKENPGKKVTYIFKKDSPKGYVFFIDKKLVKEGGDHEVSMAKSSLEQIVAAAQELMVKLGDGEKDIPGWIQDHITNAENYIHQAAKNFHELEGGHDTEDVQDMSLESILKGVKEATHKK